MDILTLERQRIQVNITRCTIALDVLEQVYCSLKQQYGEQQLERCSAYSVGQGALVQAAASFPDSLENSACHEAFKAYATTVIRNAILNALKHLRVIDKIEQPYQAIKKAQSGCYEQETAEYVHSLLSQLEANPEGLEKQDRRAIKALLLAFFQEKMTSTPVTLTDYYSCICPICKTGNKKEKQEEKYLSCPTRRRKLSRARKRIKRWMRKSGLLG